MTEHTSTASEKSQIISVPTHDLAPKSLRPYQDMGEPVVETAATDVNAESVGHAFRRNKWLGLILGILASIPLAGLTWFFIQPKFEATALIRISPQHIPLLFETADRSNTAGRVDFKSYKNTQRQLMLSPLLLGSAMKKPVMEELATVKIQDDPVAWIQSKLKVTFPDEAEIMQVSLSLTDGVEARKIVDTIVNTYYEDVVILDQNERLKRIDNLERVKADAENKARSLRSELRGLAESLGTSDALTLNLAQQASFQQYNLIRTELTKVHIDLMRAEGELKSLAQKSNEIMQVSAQSETAKLLPDQLGDFSLALDSSTFSLDLPADAIAVENVETAEQKAQLQQNRLHVAQLMESDPMGSQYIAEVTRYENLILNAEKRLAPQAAAQYVQEYRGRLQDAQKKVHERESVLENYLLETEAAKAEAEAKKQAEIEAKRVADLEAKIMLQSLRETKPIPEKPERDIPREIEILKSQEQRLSEELRIQDAESKKIGRSSIEIDMLVKEVDGLDKVVGGITEELERTKIEMKANSRITVLGPARIPETGEAKRRLPITAAAGFFGLMAPLALLVGLDLRKKLVNNRRSITNTMLMPVLGIVPDVPRKYLQVKSNLQRTSNSVGQRQLDDSVASVTAMLLHKNESEGLRVILVSSANGREGKSTLAIQLALSLAQAGRSTLLVDSDLRRPIVHQRFQLSRSPGVTDVLRQGIELEEAVQTVDHPLLKVLTAGTECPGSLLHDAATGALRALFITARANYDFVIVDSASLLPVTDGRIIGRYTDGVILSVYKDVSKIPDVKMTQDILEDYGIPMLGCVISGDREAVSGMAYK